MLMFYWILIGIFAVFILWINDIFQKRVVSNEHLIICLALGIVTGPFMFAIIAYVMYDVHKKNKI